MLLRSPTLQILYDETCNSDFHGDHRYTNYSSYLKMVWKRYRNITQPELSLSRNVWGGSTTTWPKRRHGGRQYWRHRASSLPAHLVNHEPHLEPPSAPHSKYCELFWSAGKDDCDYRKLKNQEGPVFLWHLLVFLFNTLLMFCFCHSEKAAVCLPFGNFRVRACTVEIFM